MVVSMKVFGIIAKIASLRHPQKEARRDIKNHNMKVSNILATSVIIRPREKLVLYNTKNLSTKV